MSRDIDDKRTFNFQYSPFNLFMKIGYIWQYESHDLPPSSATALHVQAVIRGFERRGHAVRMVTVRQGRPHYSDDLKTWHRIVLPRHFVFSPPYRLFERLVRGVQGRLHLPFVRWFESYRFSLACSAALAGYDVSYERFWVLAYGGLLSARRMRIPHVYEVNGDLIEEYEVLGIKLSRAHWAAIRTVTHWMFTRAARVIAVSQPLRERTIECWNVPSTQVVDVPNGADVGLFIHPEGVEAAAARYGLNGGPKIMFVGNFQPWHGLDLLLDAFAHVAPGHASARLVLVGDGPIRDELEQQASRLGLSEQVEFTGRAPHGDVAALLNLAQVAVVTPRLSQVALSMAPLKLFEYMAAGKAIIAPAISSYQRFLQDRVNALLVAPSDPAALAAALDELLSDESLCSTLGQAAQAQALERHSWDAVVQRLEGIFNEELGRS